MVRQIRSAVMAAVLLPGQVGVCAARTVPDAAVTIRRDTYGVPHIFASSTYGLFYGFGYALAEDQLYQIELLRRTARGRLAEVLGRAQVDNDRAARTRFDVASLERQYGTLAPEDQAIFQGMANGINALIARTLRTRATLLPKGFIDAGFLPEQWTPIDVIAVYEHSMVLRFSDLNAELDNLALLTRLRALKGPVEGGRIFDQLRPIVDAHAPTTVQIVDAATVPFPASVQPAPIGNALPNGLVGLADAVRYGPAGPTAAALDRATIPHASNAWLAAPRRTGNGSAILVNGPQMGDFSAAYIWAVGLHGAGFNVVGSGPVGSPWLVFGTNGRIGWGATAGLGDSTDIYQERLDPNDPHRYFFRGAMRSMTRRDETITVKGEPPDVVTIWSTVHGQVEMFDPGANRAYARRRAWDGYEVASLVDWVRAMQASDYAAWRARVSRVAVSVNNYYADARGNIAYQFLGRFPSRPPSQDPRLPVSGDGDMEWTGIIAGTQNPHVLNPRQGIIANWNNRPQPGYPSSDFMPWTATDRQNELTAMLAAAPALDRDGIWDIIRATSSIDVNARYFLPAISRAGRSGDAAHAARLLAGWNGVVVNPATRRATPQYILFSDFLGKLLADLYAPALPPAGTPARKAVERDLLHVDPVFPSLGVKGAVSALNGPPDNALLAGRTADMLVATALASAWHDVTARRGGDPAIWAVPARPHVFATANYAGVPQSAAGDALRLPVFMNRGTENDRIVFHRGRVNYCDVTPPGESSFVAPGGARSAHFADQLSLYAAFACKRQWLDPRDVVRHTVRTYSLRYSP